MCCIEKALQERKKFVKELRDQRKFPEAEALFLTGIYVDGELRELTPYGIRDAGRMMGGRTRAYKERFPKGATDMVEHYKGRPSTRKWDISSTGVEPIKIRPECRSRVAALVHRDLDDHLCIE